MPVGLPLSTSSQRYTHQSQLLCIIYLLVLFIGCAFPAGTQDRLHSVSQYSQPDYAFNEQCNRIWSIEIWNQPEKSENQMEAKPSSINMMPTSCVGVNICEGP